MEMSNLYYTKVMQKESIPDLENLPESPIALGSEISGVK